MAAELSKQKFVLRAATLLFLLLLSVITYGAITDTFVVTSTDVIYDAASGNFIYHDVGINHSKQLAAIDKEQELEVVVKVSYMDFCTVMWKNKHLMRHVPQRRMIEYLCQLRRQSGNATDTVMEETSNIAPGESVEETETELPDSLDQTSRLDKLTEWCKHRDQIDNIIVRHLLRGICRNINKPGTIIPVKSSGTVTATHVGLDSDVTTEAVADVTPETTHDYSSQPMVTSVPSSVTGEGRSIDASDVLVVVCANLHLINVPSLTRRALNIVCRFVRLSDTGKNRTSDTNGASDVAQYQGLSSQISRLDKVREVCTHLDEANNVSHLSTLLPSICSNIDEPNTIIPVKSSGTVTETHVSLESDVTTEAVVDVTPETTHDYSSQPMVISVPSSVTGEGRSTDASDVSVVVCANLHLINAPSLTRRVLNIVCRFLRHSENADARVLLDTGKSTTSDTERASDVAQYLGLSSQISRLDKVREVCTHLDEAKNVSDLSKFLPSICSNIDEPITNSPAGSFGTFSSEQAMTKSDAKPEPVTEGTRQRAKMELAARSADPATDESPMEAVPIAVCEYQHLLGRRKTRFQRAVLKSICRPMICPRGRRAATTEATSGHDITTVATGTPDGTSDTRLDHHADPALTSTTLPAEPSVQTSSLIKLREVCKHLGQINNLIFRPLLSGICNHLDKPGWTTEPCKWIESPPRDVNSYRMYEI